MTKRRSTATVPPRSAGVIGGAVLLAIGSVLVCAVLLAAKPVMTGLMAHMSTMTTGNAPLMETVFNVLVFGVILIAGLVGGAIDRQAAWLPGPHPGRRMPIGLAIGLGGVSVSAGYAALAGTLAPGAGGAISIGVLAWGAAVVLLQTVAEEIYFRGWLQPALQRRWGLAAALIATALAFAALHVAGGARGAISLVNLFLGGLVFGLLAAWGRGLALPVGAHFAWNAVEQLGYGLDPNPGTGSFGSVRDWDLVGPALWGGSEEGLNASLGMTFALLAILAPLALLCWRSLLRGDAEPRGTIAAA